MLNNLGSAWIVSEEVLCQLSLEDLRSLNVPHDFCVGFEMSECAEL